MNLENDFFCCLPVPVLAWVAVLFLSFVCPGSDCLDCYACGLSIADPVEEGFSYNTDPEDPLGKMYNETCSSFATFQIESPSAMSKWIRPCPPDVKSCFWAQGMLNDESESLDTFYCTK